MREAGCAGPESSDLRLEESRDSSAATRNVKAGCFSRSASVSQIPIEETKKAREAVVNDLSWVGTK